MKKIILIAIFTLLLGSAYAVTPTLTVTATVTQTSTPTVTITATPTITPTPIHVTYYTDKTIASGSIVVDTANGTKDVDLSSIALWIPNGFVVSLSSDLLPFDGKITAYKHATSFTAAIEDFFIGTPIDCSTDTTLVRYNVFRIPPP